MRLLNTSPAVGEGLKLKARARLSATERWDDVQEWVDHLNVSSPETILLVVVGALIGLVETNLPHAKLTGFKPVCAFAACRLA